MFDELLRKYPPKDAIKPSRKRAKKDIAAVLSLIEKEECPMSKRKRRLKPLIITAAVMIFMLALVVTVNAATKGAVVKFFMGGEEIEGDYIDYVDNKGYRHISFAATLPIYEENFAIIFDVDAPREEAVRVVTAETDPDLMGRIRQYHFDKEKYSDDLKAWYDEHNITQEDFADPDSEFHKTFDPVEAIGRSRPEPEDYELVFKDSELCLFRLGFVTKDEGFYLADGNLGGEFMNTGAAAEHRHGIGDKEHPNECNYDWDNEIKTYRDSFYYYVGKE